jgi:predicted PhzF superfamily epimerase YddE/YHI9
VDAVRIFTVDAFTDKAFAGNPAAVVLLHDDDTAEADDRWMQQVAAEMNLSETAFLMAGPDAWGLRWFTPAVEVDLCGHATLASAHVLYDIGLAPPDELIRFSTRSGILTAGPGAGGAITLDFPAEPPAAAAPPPGLLEALGSPAVWTGRNRFDVFVELADEDAVRRLRPDMAALGKIDMRGVIVTATSGEARIDFVSRFFGPAVGVPEDPVTGSAHCALGPFWAGRLGRTALRGRQVSARGGLVGVDVRGDRVGLTGTAVTVLEGTLRGGLR